MHSKHLFLRTPRTSHTPSHHTHLNFRSSSNLTPSFRGSRRHFWRNVSEQTSLRLVCWECKMVMKTQSKLLKSYDFIMLTLSYSQFSTYCKLQFCNFVDLHVHSAFQGFSSNGVCLASHAFQASRRTRTLPDAIVCSSQSLWEEVRRKPADLWEEGQGLRSPCLPWHGSRSPFASGITCSKQMQMPQHKVRCAKQLLPATKVDGVPCAPT